MNEITYKTVTRLGSKFYDTNMEDAIDTYLFHGACTLYMSVGFKLENEVSTRVWMPLFSKSLSY